MPERITFSRLGYPAVGSYGWTLTISKDGQAALQLESFDFDPVTFSIGADAAPLFKAVAAAETSSLPAQVGYGIPDGPMRRIIVEGGGQRHEMTIYVIDRMSHTQQQESVVELWRLVRDVLGEDILDDGDLISERVAAELHSRLLVD